MTVAQITAIVLIALGGAAIAVQAPVNAALGRSLGTGLGAAAVSFGVGFVVLALLTVVTGSSGSASRLGSVPWWQVTGGLLGAFYVWAVISGVGSIGVVTMVAALILGQLCAALALDAAGAFGLPQHGVTWQRVLAVAMVAGGLVLSRA